MAKCCVLCNFKGWNFLADTPDFFPEITSRKKDIS